MINKKLGYGLVTSLVLGLSACSMDNQQAQEVDYSTNKSAATQATAATPKQAQQKTYASKDPVQKATPGPKRAAAPQIPVIQ